MDHGRETNSKLSHEQKEHFSKPNPWPNNAYFNEELSSFTSRVVRAENAKYAPRTREEFKSQQPAATKPSSRLLSSQMRCRPDSQRQSSADKGVEHIVLENIYYAIRNDSDREDVFLNPREGSIGGNSRHDENGERVTEEESDGYFGGRNHIDSTEEQEGNDLTWTQTRASERSNVRHKRPTQGVHNSLSKEYERPFQKGCNHRRTLHVNQSASNEGISSHLHRPSRSRSVSQGSNVFSDSSPRARAVDYNQAAGQTRSGESPEILSSGKRSQAQSHKDFERREPYSSTNTIHISAVNNQKDDFMASWNGTASTENRGVASGCGTSSSSLNSEAESGVNFVKLRKKVEQVVLDVIRRQMGNADETGEAQMLVRVAQDILFKANGIRSSQTQEEISDSDISPSPVGKEKSIRVLAPMTGQGYQGNNGYSRESVFHGAVSFARKESKRKRGKSLGDCSEITLKPKYVRHESTPELKTYERVSSDSRTDLRRSQDVATNSSRQVCRQQPEWIAQDIVVVANTSSWRPEEQQDGEAEFRRDIREGIKDTLPQRVTEQEKEQELEGSETNRKESSPGTSFRLCNSNLKSADFAHATELCENSGQRSPSNDDCVEVLHSSPSQSSQQNGHDPLYTGGDSFGQPWDGPSGRTLPDTDQGNAFPISIFKRAQMMQHDKHATLRVFSTLFQPFSCSHSYTYERKAGGNQKSGDDISHNGAARLSSSLATLDSPNPQKCSSGGEGSSRVSQEQQMECSSTDENSGDQNIRIISVCSLQNTHVQGDVESPIASETSATVKITENQGEGKPENPPPYFEDLSDNTQDTSTAEETAERETTAAEPLPLCIENSSDNLKETSSRKEMAGKPVAPAEDPHETSGRNRMTDRQTGAAQDVSSSNSMDNLEIISSERGQSYSKRSRSSCSKCCNRNGSLDRDKSYRKVPKELLDSTRWSDTKLFVCPWINCNWHFKRNDELTRHWYKHTGEKPYPCCNCKKTFARRDQLRCHTKTFHSLTHVDMEMEFKQSGSIQS